MKYHCKEPEPKDSIFEHCGCVFQDEYEAFKHAAETRHSHIEPY